jgi:hypothetical protein
MLIMAIGFVVVMMIVIAHIVFVSLALFANIGWAFKA